jgi:leader peptidase (prepilin peptidase)/N-methyltransferase
MNVELAALALAPGLAVGSFLNVVAARVPRRLSIVAPRSACPSCGTQLAWYDNVPLVSYALLRGRCRYCAEPISWRYPAVELLTGVLVAVAALRFGLTWDFAVAAFVVCVLVVVSATDLELRVIPNRVVVPGAAAVLVANTLIHPSIQWAVAALAAAAFLFAAALAYPGGMGMGDVKLVLFLGAACGRAVGVALLAGMVAALVPAVVLLARHGSAARKMAIPFGPFLALGGLLALFFGDRILDWYLGVV